MIGAIIGDIAGSRFEFNNHRSKDFELFTDACRLTDDSVMTLAIAKAIMEADRIQPLITAPNPLDELQKQAVVWMRELGHKYPYCGFGGMFKNWMTTVRPQPYNSFGNGAAMRVSPAGQAGKTEADAIRFAHAVTRVTHNHPEGMKGAEATVVAMVKARANKSKEAIRARITTDYYPLNFTIDGIRPTYRFNATCQKTVPQAIEAFLESTSFEDAIRTAISVGGDSDTLAAITGAIAEACYGVPDELRQKALAYMDAYQRSIYDDWQKFLAAA